MGNEIKKKGITSNIVIENDVVIKTVLFRDLSKELLDREEFWLKKLAVYDIAPQFISRNDNSITMSYCGKNATLKDFERQEILVQLMNIIKILLKNHCFYNDFKASNFTIKNNKLYIIDFGWCPMIIEDFTCGGNIESELKRKPFGNVFNLL